MIAEADDGPSSARRRPDAGEDVASGRGDRSEAWTEADGEPPSLGRVPVPGSSGPTGPSPWYPVVKRMLDAVLAAVQAVVCLPAWIVVPLAVKLEDGGPVFYGQERVGRGGRRFRSWKFRSMTPRDDASDGPLQQADLEGHRVTRVGRVLRATALDELPQLWNIFVGDMSYVGPRPLLPRERSAARGGEVVRLERLPGYEERHRVRPGLTGLAQVRLPRDASHVEKIRLDVKYVRNRSLAVDLGLILESIWISLRGAWPEVGTGERGDRNWGDDVDGG